MVFVRSSRVAQAISLWLSGSALAVAAAGGADATEAKLKAWRAQLSVAELKAAQLKAAAEKEAKAAAEADKAKKAAAAHPKPAAATDAAAQKTLVELQDALKVQEAANKLAEAKAAGTKAGEKRTLDDVTAEMQQKAAALKATQAAQQAMQDLRKTMVVNQLDALGTQLDADLVGAKSADLPDMEGVDALLQNSTASGEQKKQIMDAFSKKKKYAKAAGEAITRVAGGETLNRVRPLLKGLRIRMAGYQLDLDEMTGVPFDILEVKGGVSEIPALPEKSTHRTTSQAMEQHEFDNLDAVSEKTSSKSSFYAGGGYNAVGSASYKRGKEQEQDGTSKTEAAGAETRLVMRSVRYTTNGSMELEPTNGPYFQLSQSLQQAAIKAVKLVRAALPSGKECQEYDRTYVRELFEKRTTRKKDLRSGGSGEEFLSSRNFFRTKAGTATAEDAAREGLFRELRHILNHYGTHLATRAKFGGFREATTYGAVRKASERGEVTRAMAEAARQAFDVAAAAPAAVPYVGGVSAAAGASGEQRSGEGEKHGTRSTEATSDVHTTFTSGGDPKSDEFVVDKSNFRFIGELISDFYSSARGGGMQVITADARSAAADGSSGGTPPRKNKQVTLAPCDFSQLAAVLKRFWLTEWMGAPSSTTTVREWTSKQVQNGELVRFESVSRPGTFLKCDAAPDRVRSRLALAEGRQYYSGGALDVYGSTGLSTTTDEDTFMTFDHQTVPNLPRFLFADPRALHREMASHYNASSDCLAHLTVARISVEEATSFSGDRGIWDGDFVLLKRQPGALRAAPADTAGRALGGRGGRAQGLGTDQESGDHESPSYYPCALEEDVEVYGGDIDGMAAPTASAIECGKKCALEGLCEAFTWIQSGPGQGQCVFKAAAPREANDGTGAPYKYQRAPRSKGWFFSPSKYVSGNKCPGSVDSSVQKAYNSVARKCECVSASDPRLVPGVGTCFPLGNEWETAVRKSLQTSNPAEALTEDGMALITGQCSRLECGERATPASRREALAQGGNTYLRMKGLKTLWAGETSTQLSQVTLNKSPPLKGFADAARDAGNDVARIQFPEKVAMRASQDELDTNQLIFRVRKFESSNLKLDL